VIPPPVRVVKRPEKVECLGKANQISFRHRHGDVVAVNEIVSPGNKASQGDFREFIDESTKLLRGRSSPAGRRSFSADAA
jgi:hypothetical protein